MQWKKVKKLITSLFEIYGMAGIISIKNDRIFDKNCTEILLDLLCA